MLPLVGIKVQLHPAGNVLPQVEEEPAIGRLHGRWREALVHRDRHVVGGRRDHVVVRHAGVAGVAWRARGIDDLAVLVVGKEDGAVVRPLPVRPCYHALHDAVGVRKLQLRQELGLGAVLVEQSPCAARAPVPAVGKLHRKLVAAGCKRLRHVVGLVLDALAVVRVAGRHAEAADLLAINARLVEAAGRDVEACAHQAGRNIKGATEAVHGIAAL